MSKTRTLSKSDFKVAQECPTKLFYRKQQFPSTMQDNPYLQLLAEGGYAVGYFAQLLFPGGIDLGEIGDPAEAERRTQELVQQEDAIIFEAAVRHENYLVRVDVLVKRGKTVELIEVKSKSYDSHAPDMLNKSGKLDTKWRPYVEDVAFQTMVLRLAFPALTIQPFLMVMDKSRTTEIEGLNSQFEIREKPPTPGSTFKGYDVKFTGDLEELQKSKDLLVKIPMEDLVTPMLPTLSQAAAGYAASLDPELTRIAPVLEVKCGKCEYRNAANGDASQDGFRNCWGKLADVTPSVLDLYRAGNFKQDLNALIKEGRVAIADVPDEVLQKKDGTYSYNGRPHMQKHLKKEVISPELRSEVKSWTYPLHFIDFETSRMALPYHKGMRPYEQIAFQWSCHTLRNGVDAPEHHEWINTVDAFPSFKFARALMEAIGTEGTVLIWSSHENTTLRDIRRQMDQYEHHDPELAAWLDHIAPSKASEQDMVMVDMDALARSGYFHPSTRAKTSIKFTLPAVLQAQTSKRIPAWLQNFEEGVNLLGHDTSGVINPYKLLPAIQLIDNYVDGDEEGEDYLVNEGTGAMRAYQDMLYGLAKNDPLKMAKLRGALLTYCKLDTLAMVVIWEHWRGVQA